MTQCSLSLCYVHVEMQAGEIDELLTPGYPVFFNYASVSADKVPLSLKVVMVALLQNLCVGLILTKII